MVSKQSTISDRVLLDPFECDIGCGGKISVRKAYSSER
jgi:hypothetical protein